MGINTGLADMLRKLGFTRNIVVRVPDRYAPPWHLELVVYCVMHGALVEWENIN